MPRKSPLAVGAASVIRASPPLKSITKASTSLTRASIARRHYLRALLSLIATRNLIKSFLLFRPVNRKTLKPGSPLWKVAMKAVWLAIWPSLSKTLSESLIKKPVTEGAEVNACKDESVSKEGGPSLVVVAPEQEIEVNFVISESEENESEEKENSDAEVKVEEDAAARAKAIDEAFQKEFSAVEELVLTEGVKAAAG